MQGGGGPAVSAKGRTLVPPAPIWPVSLLASTSRATPGIDLTVVYVLSSCK